MPRPDQETLPPQHQDRQPGIQSEMRPRPLSEDSSYRPAGKLGNKVALITGGDSGIGRAVAIAFAKEGADVAVSYLNEHGDAGETRRRVEEHERRAIILPGDIGDEAHCGRLVQNPGIAGFSPRLFENCRGLKPTILTSSSAP